MSEERDRNRLNIHEIKELSSYPRTAFLSTDCLSTGIVYLPMHCLSTRIVFLPTDSSYLRIVFLPTDCLPTWSVSLHGLSSYQRILFLPTDLLFYSPLLACSKQHGHQVRHTPGAQSPGRSPGPSHTWGTVTRAVLGCVA